LAAILAAATVLVGGCDDSDAPLQTTESGSDYLVYFSHDADSFNYYIPIYSTRELAAVDSLTFTWPAEFPHDDMRFTSDGKYVLYASSTPLGGHRIWTEDYHTGDTLGMNSVLVHLQLKLSPDDSHVAAFRTGDEGLYIYSVPDLNSIWDSDSVQFTDVEFLTEPGKIVFVTGSTDTFYVIDFIDSPDSIARFPAAPIYHNTTFLPRALALDAERDLLWAVGPTATGRVYLQVYDANSLTLIRRIPIPSNYRYSGPLVSPCGSYVYLATTYAFEQDQTTGILRYSSSAATLIQWLPASDLLYPPFMPAGLAITPDGRTMCVKVSGVSGGPGDLLLIDVASREIVQVFSHHWGTADFIRIYPISR